ATYVFSASRGRLNHILPEVAELRQADFNGDGIPDLYWLGQREDGRSDRRPLHTIRGTLPECWRWLGQGDPHRISTATVWSICWVTTSIQDSRPSRDATGTSSGRARKRFIKQNLFRLRSETSMATA